MNIDSKIKASDLAAFAGYSEYYLTRKFKEETGFFINDYVKAAKIERAKVLLSSSDNSIQDISNQLGFTNRSYFSQVFRDLTGMTPVSFREQQQSNR
jgi:AraC-like DNA-binding protein